MNVYRITGVILLVVGLVCLGFGWNSSNTVVDKISAATTGRFRQTTIWYLVGGIAAVIGGGALVLGGRPKP